MGLNYCLWCGNWLVDTTDFCCDKCREEYEALLNLEEEQVINY